MGFLRQLVNLSLFFLSVPKVEWNVLTTLGIVIPSCYHCISQKCLYFWEPSAFLWPSRTNQMSLPIRAVLSYASSQLETQAMNQDKPFCPKLPSFLLFWEKSNF